MTDRLSWGQVREIETEADHIPEWALRRDPTLHFCPDWDYMLLGRHSSREELYICDCKDRVLTPT